MKSLLPVTCLLLAAQGVRADAPKAAATAPLVDTKSVAAPAFVPKTRSVFTASVNAHNPFWPIGWVKTADNTSEENAPTVPHTEDFTVTTIMLNDPPMAVINGKDMAEGEVASMPVGGQNVTVQLMAVQDGRVILRWQNQNLIVPLHREEELTEAQPPTGVQ